MGDLKPTGRLLNLGCGKNLLPHPWQNKDRGWQDLLAPGDVRVILFEHVIEHLPLSEAIGWLIDFKEALRGGGVLRLCFPDCTRAEVRRKPYEAFAREHARLGGVRSILSGWGHVSAWTGPLAKAALMSLGYGDVCYEHYGQSEHPVLQEVDGHHLEVGREVAEAETTVLEATSP
jgi:hypothetical protein